MRSSYRIYNKEGLFFVTSTIVEWIKIFTSYKYFKILIDSIVFSQEEKGLKIYSYVILSNHFHMIVSGTNLTNVFRSIKSYSAKRILEELKIDNNTQILNKLRSFKLNHKSGSEFQVWQEGYHPKEILNNSMFQQKMDYIHLNPVRLNLVEKPGDWKYSSASFFETGAKGIIEINGFDY